MPHDLASGEASVSSHDRVPGFIVPRSHGLGNITDRSALLVLAAITLAGAAIRFTNLHAPFWFDEVMSTLFIHQPFSRLWSDWMIRETNPPVYYSLLKGWAMVFGEGDAALRSLSAVIGVVALPLIYALVRSVQPRGPALTAAVMLCFSGPALIYSQQVRVYGLTLVLAMVVLILVMHMLARAGDGFKPGFAANAGYVAATSAALYSHTTMVILPFLCSVFILYRVLDNPKSRFMLVYWFAANAVVLLIWLWWAHITYEQVLHSNNVAWLKRPSFQQAVFTTIASYGLWHAKHWLVVVSLAALFLIGTWHLRRSIGLLLPFIAIGLPVAAFLISFSTPVFADKTIFWGSGPFIATVAVGIWSLRNPCGIAACIVAWVTIGAYDQMSMRRPVPPGYPDVIARIKSIDPGAVVLTNDPFALRRYCTAHCRLAFLSYPSNWIDRTFGGAVLDGSDTNVRRLPISHLFLSRGSRSNPGLPVARWELIQSWEIPAEPKISLYRYVPCPISPGEMAAKCK